MNQKKREYRRVIEKQENLTGLETLKESCYNPVRCISCNKILAEVDEVVMGRVLVKCGHCGVKNRIDNNTNVTRTGSYLM